MEREIKIKTTDNKYIYGILRLPNNAANLNEKPLVVFVHGLTGHKNATHCFDEDGTEEKLFQETYNWFLKFK